MKSIMFIKSIKMQWKVILGKKSIYIVFYILLVFVFANYFYNVFTYSGKDVVDMYHPMKLLLLSDNSGYGFYFMQIYPLLVVIPAGFSYASDKGSREVVLYSQG